LAYFPAVPITIELPDLESQTEFNLARWAEVLADPTLTTLPHRVETDQHGHILMSPPPAPIHGRHQAHIAGLLRQFLPDGIAFSECPLSTAGGVKAIDVAWLAPERSEDISRLPSSSVRQRSVLRLSPLAIRAPKSSKSVPCTWTPAPPRSGFATSTAPFPFLWLLTINYVLLPFVRHFQAASPDFPPGAPLRRLRLSTALQSTQRLGGAAV
jgi:hypothetical protein